jgi:hypothetical protein
MLTLRRTPSAGHEVHDQRDHRKDQEDMNEEATYVKHEKSAEPKENEDNCQD